MLDGCGGAALRGRSGRRPACSRATWPARPCPRSCGPLADGVATGCLHVVDGAGERAKVYLRGGRVYAVIAPGRRPQLGARLVSSGALGPEALAEALEAQRTELQGWRLGELLVHLGYVDQPVVEAFVEEQVREGLADLLPWRDATWRFRVNERTREDVAPPVEVERLLSEVAERQAEWDRMAAVLHGPDAVPLLSAAGTADAEIEIDADAWSLLCKVDGVRTVTELARECGFTLYEAGRVVVTLVEAGLLEVEDDADAVEPPVVEQFVPSDVAARLAGALGGHPVDEVEGSISRVSEALAALLGPATASDDVFAAPAPRVPQQVLDPEQVERERRAQERRDRDAAELAEAQAELEAARAAERERCDALDASDAAVAEVVHLSAVREEARLAAEAERGSPRRGGAPGWPKPPASPRSSAWPRRPKPPASPRSSAWPPRPKPPASPKSSAWPPRPKPPASPKSSAWPPRPSRSPRRRGAPGRRSRSRPPRRAGAPRRRRGRSRPPRRAGAPGRRGRSRPPRRAGAPGRRSRSRPPRRRAAPRRRRPKPHASPRRSACAEPKRRSRPPRRREQRLAAEAEAARVAEEQRLAAEAEAAASPRSSASRPRPKPPASPKSTPRRRSRSRPPRRGAAPGRRSRSRPPRRGAAPRRADAACRRSRSRPPRRRGAPRRRSRPPRCRGARRRSCSSRGGGAAGRASAPRAGASGRGSCSAPGGAPRAGGGG